MPLVLLLAPLLGCGGDPAPDARPVDSDTGSVDTDEPVDTDPVDTDEPVDTSEPVHTGAPTSGSRAAFVAQGHLGRRALSCDDGGSWGADQSDETGGGTCWSGPLEIECDHDPGAGRGVTWGDGWFFATFGWGAPGSIRRSADGVDWEVVDEGGSYGGVVYLDGVLLAAARYARTSSDQGLTWSAEVDTGMIGWNVRRAGRSAGRFVLVGDSDDIVTSADGQTWSAPSVLPAGCGANVQTEGGIAHGGGVLLVVGGDGVACASTDEGDTFTRTDLGAPVSSHLVWSGTDFVVYGGGLAYRSVDGVTWTTTPIVGVDVDPGPVAVSDQGTFVAIEGGWGDWYEDQQAYRSDDGITWTTLDATAFTGGHPVRDLAFGHVLPSPTCP
jgi:hypothetical protein